MDCRLIYGVTLVIGFLTLAVNGLKISSSVPVEALNTSITRDTCGQKKVCLETPGNCDPSSNGTCLFVSAAEDTDDKAVDFELRGDSGSYVALIVSKDNMQGNDSAFVCARYNGSNFFFTATFDNGSLTVTNTSEASDVHVAYETNLIRCTFAVSKSTFESKSNKLFYRRVDDPFYIFAGNGSFVSGLLGDPTILLTSNGSVTLLDSDSDSDDTTSVSVGSLSTAINRVGCGSSKFCVEEPVDCDPSGTSQCHFISATSPSTSSSTVNFEMSGNSTGYMALILSTDLTEGGNDTAFVCAQSNNTIQFFTTTLDNGTLTMTDEADEVATVLGSLTDNIIRCTFSALELNSTSKSRRSSQSFRIFGATGDFTNGTLGAPTTVVKSSGIVDLASFPNGSASLRSASLALLLLLSVLIFRLV